MTIAKQIENARAHLKVGNKYAYAAQISAGIRSAMSDRSANSFRRAISEDGAEYLFDGLNTNTTIPREELATA